MERTFMRGSTISAVLKLSEMQPGDSAVIEAPEGLYNVLMTPDRKILVDGKIYPECGNLVWPGCQWSLNPGMKVDVVSWAGYFSPL
jgi:hypothetical protein